MLDDSFVKIADEAPVMLWVADPDKKFIYFNSSWLKFRGQTLESETSGNWKDGVHSEDIISVNKQFENCFDNRKPYKLEYRLKRYDGNYRWIIENGIPRFDVKDNRFKGFVGSCVDIHEIKELEKRKEEFITAASHELKTPITSLTVYLHLIDEYFNDRKLEKFSAYSQGAILQLNKINALIDQMLDLSKIQSGSLSYTWSEFSFGDLVANIIEKIKLLYPQRDIVFKGQYSGLIKGDVERMSHAIENLLNNAIKFSTTKDAIIVEINQDGKFTTLDITDYGIGIAKEYLGKIFERFFRIPGHIEATYPGMGMGLYLTQKIINKHKGTIHVESVENEYTKFSIKIPLL